MSRAARSIWCCLALVLLAGAALAHKPSDSYLTIEVQGGRQIGRAHV